MKSNEFSFDELKSADLIVDAIYRGGDNGIAEEPLNELFHCGIGGGFRPVGHVKSGGYRFVVLYTQWTDPDWPDFLERHTGLFYYYGDNKHPGKQLLETKRRGNQLLERVFNDIHQEPTNREAVPPFFVFAKLGEGRGVTFLGLSAPGSQETSPNEQLMAIWKTAQGMRFQNYRAVFTILDLPLVPRAWIDELQPGSYLGKNCPEVWRKWVKTGIYTPLRAEKTVEYRLPVDQLPSTDIEKMLVTTIFEHFKGNPFGFEQCAAELVRLMDSNVTQYELTRFRRDGGRDAVGLYRIGSRYDGISIVFALEAKCYNPKNGVNTKEISRLISRLRHRQFGVLVTTSYVGIQAYKEIREDLHPVVIIAGKDIARILLENGIKNKSDVESWLATLES